MRIVSIVPESGLSRHKAMSKDKGKKTNFETYGFGRVNLLILLGSLLLLIIGYLLMSGGASTDGVTFNPEVFSPLRIRVAPLVRMLGYAGIAVAILWRKRSDYKESDSVEETPSDDTTKPTER